jgi:Cys-tRNA(Pro)/Cys-tRNA(Cys) deacylase
VVLLSNKSYALALMPGDRQLSLKKIAGVCRTKRATLADAESAHRLTGYLIGGISPFGTRKRLPVVMERQLLSYNDVMINGGRRGILLKMRPEDILKALNAKTYDLTSQYG